jgi:hypothetical protein
MAGGAFLAGAVLAGFALKLPGRSSPEQTVATVAQPSAKSATVTPAPAPAPTEASTAATTAAAPTPAAKPDATAAATPAKAVPCEQQAWPYVDKACGTGKQRVAKTKEAPPETPARVIAPERDASAEPAPAAVADTNTGAAPNPEPVTFPAAATESTPRTTTLAKVPLPRARPIDRTTPDLTRVAAPAAAPVEESPVVSKRRRPAVAATEPAAAPAATAPAAAAPTAAAASDESRANRRRPIVAATDPDADADTVTAAPVESPRVSAREARRLSRTERRVERRRLARAPAQSLQAQNEAEGFRLVHQRILPDGRRVSVYRRYNEPPANIMAYGEPRGEPFRRPFSWPGF